MRTSKKPISGARYFEPLEINKIRIVPMLTSTIRARKISKGRTNHVYKPDEVKAMYLADALNAVAGGESVEMAETKALGCSIKFRAADKSEAKDKDKDKS